MASTCTTCKKRKVKCDGQKPVCGSCSGRDLTASACDYSFSRQSQSPTTSLARGDACLPCRKKKKKCNGERPACRTCVIAKKTDYCVYNADSVPHLITTLVERNRELEKLLESSQMSSRSSESPPTPPDSTLNFDPVTLDFDMESMAAFDSIWPNGTSIEGMDVSTLDPLKLPNIDRQSQSTDATPSSITALSPIPHAITAVEAQFTNSIQDEFISLRELLLQYGIVMGQSFTRKKLQALYLGDTSCTIIHPALVHVVQLFGACMENRHRIEMPLVDEEQHQTNALMLLSIPPLNLSDAVAHIQCYCLLSVHFMKRHDITTGREWLLRADSVVQQFNLHITLPDRGRCHIDTTGENDQHAFFYKDLIAEDEEDEMRDALTQLLYIDSVTSFRMQLPPLVSPRLQREFETLVQHCITKMKECSLVVVRMTSIILLQEAHAAMLKGGSVPLAPNVPAPSVLPPTIRQIYLYLADLNELIIGAQNDVDRPRYLMLKQCTLVAVTALASTYNLSFSTQSESQRKCLDSIAEMVSISDSLRPEDCRHLDPIISACWSIGLRILLQIQLGIDDKSSGRERQSVHLKNVPIFIQTLQNCASKVKWSFPLTGGIPLTL